MAHMPPEHFRGLMQWVVEQGRDFPATYRNTFLTIGKHFNPEGKCFLRYDTIADEAGCTEKTAINHVKALCERGILHKHARFNPDGTQTSNEYTFVRIFEVMDRMKEFWDQRYRPKDVRSDEGTDCKTFSQNSTDTSFIEKEDILRDIAIPPVDVSVGWESFGSGSKPDFARLEQADTEEGLESTVPTPRLHRLKELVEEKKKAEVEGTVLS